MATIERTNVGVVGALVAVGLGFIVLSGLFGALSSASSDYASNFGGITALVGPFLVPIVVVVVVFLAIFVRFRLR